MRAIGALVLFIGLAGPLRAQEAWYPSPYGADDTLGAINNLSPAGVVGAAKLVRSGKTYALGVDTGPSTPAFGTRSFQIHTLAAGDGTGASLGTNKATYNDDLLITWVGIGSQIDGLGHVGIDHVHYNGTPVGEFLRSDGLVKFSTHLLPPIVTRGVLLHTGWQELAEQDPERFLASEPGLGRGGAEYLAGLGVVAVGADTWAVEAVPAEDAAEQFPVHQILLAKNGVYLLENMNTAELAADGAWEFLFVLGQPKFVGSVQAVINPVAIR